MTNLKIITIRDIDESVYMKLKIKCIIHKCSVGTAISEAMDLWVNSKNKEEDKTSTHSAE